MTPLGWGWAAFVWGYALVWALVSDRVKLLGYRIFDPTKPPLLAKKPFDLTPQIATRAYELYEQRGRRNGQADQDWLKAEREVKAEPRPEAKAEPRPEVKAEPKPEAEAETPSDLTPGIVKRVHELYEELGREDVREVQDWEKAQRETRKDKPNK
jgi:H+-transporting ATPase